MAILGGVGGGHNLGCRVGCKGNYNIGAMCVASFQRGIQNVEINLSEMLNEMLNKM